MKINIYYRVAFFAALFFTFNSCKKDTTDFDKFNGVNFNPEFGVPFINTSLSISNLIGNDTTNVKVDGDGLIRFVYRQEGLIKYKVSDFFTLDDNSSQTIQNSLGAIDIESVSNSTILKIGDLSQNFSPLAKANFDAVKNTNNIFPPFNENVSNLSNLPAINQFGSIHFSQGWLVISVTNKFPVTINQIKLNLYNLSPVQTLIGTYNFNNILTGTTKSDSVNIANKDMSSSMGYTMPIFNSASSAPNTVPINPDDSITIALTAKNLRAVSGSAVFPSQDIVTQSTKIELNTGDTTQQIRKLGLASGRLKFVIKSTINETVQISVAFPNAKKNGVAFPAQIITIPTTGPSGFHLDSIDVGGVLFDLTKSTPKPYNNIPISYTVKVLSSNTLKTFDSSNYVYLNVATSAAAVDYAEGYFGKLNISSDTSSFINLDFLKDISEGLNLDDPKLILDITSSIGVPVTFNSNFVGQNNSGKTVDNLMQAFEILYPSVSDIGSPNEIRKTHQVFDKTNSQTDKLISLPPHKIKYSGKVTTNVNHNPSETQYISSKGILNVDLSLDLPLAMRTENFTLVDSFDFNPSAFDKFVSASVVANIDNGFPFEAKVNIVFLDTLGHAIDSMNFNQLMLSAITDANGKTIQHSMSRTEFLFDEVRIKKLVDGKARKIKTYSTLKTENNGGKVVKVYSDYDLKIKLGLIGKVNVHN